MAATAEEVRRKIENARNAGDDRAVGLLEDHLKTLDKPAPDPVAQAEPTGALPSNDTDAGGLTREDRERRILDYGYQRDQALAAGAGKPSASEAANFRMERFGKQDIGGGRSELRGDDIVKDPTTGEVRWAALSPERMDEIAAKEKDQGSLLKSIAPALASGLTRQAGQRLDDADQDIDERRNIQSVIWAQLPSHEQDRIRAGMAEEVGKEPSDITDEVIKTISARKLKEYLDQNKANAAILDEMGGDEASAARGESWRRGFNKIGAAWTPGGGALNIGGAEVAEGDITGVGQYEGLEDKYEREGLRAPIYPGASEDVSRWRSEARKAEGTFGDIYEYVIRPHFTSPEGDRPGARIKDIAELITKKTYTEEQQESVAKPFFPPDKGIKDIFSVEMWTDPNTKLPWNDWDGFVLTTAQTTPQIVEGIVAARMGGRVGASQAMKTMTGRSVMEMEKARRTWAMTGGIIAGGAAEGAMIYDEVASDVREALGAVPMEKYREDATFNRMVEAGMSEEEAKQLLVHDAATTAGKTGFVVAGVLMGSPMSAAFGRAAAGSLNKSGLPARALAGVAGEGLQEGSQEVGEGEISDTAIARIDPENPIFSDKNRRLERFAGGFFTAGPLGLMGISQPDVPVGLEKGDVEAAEATKAYFDATDARFEFEFRISDPEHIQKTNPGARLSELNKLEELQLAEAEATLKAEPVLREYLEVNQSLSSKAELKLLDALTMRANATLTDIAVARSRRQSVHEMVEEQETILNERAAIQKSVTDNIMKLEDVERQLTNIEAVQDNAPVSETDYEELLKAGYGRWTNKNKDKFVITPKGKRAMNLLNQQQRDLTKNLGQGYTGVDRRKPENLLRRETLDSAGPVEREQMIYQDHLTGMQNRRAFDERAQDAPAVAAVDVDSLAWVNDNMSHSAGDRLLVAVADAIEKQKGVEVFRLGGDEFAVTGASAEALETAMQAAVKELEDSPIGAGEEQVTPQITWGKGTTYKEADTEAASMKSDRVKRGVVAPRKGKPATWMHRAQQTLFQRDFGKSGDESMQQKLDEVNKAIEEGRVPEGRKDYAEAYKTFLETSLSLVNKETEARKELKRKLSEINDALENGTVSEDRIEWAKAYKNFLESGIRLGTRFQMDENYNVQEIPKRWRDVQSLMRRGDSVEVLTPDGAEHGVITNVAVGKRPRVDVVIGDRKYRFNPNRNHLITHGSDPADIAWITGNEEMGDPLYGPLPQIIPDVNIGFVGRDGTWYADMFDEYSPAQQELPWWTSEYPEWDTKVPFIYKAPEASEEEMQQAHAVVRNITSGYTNLPPITLVGSTAELERVNPDLVEQLRTMPGASLTGVRGFFDENVPENGVVILVQNISKYGKGLEANLSETLFHEMIGHYGVRGVFGNEKAMREHMHSIVDSFPKIAGITRNKVPRAPGATDAQYKQLIGEEMIAYITGEMLAGTIEITPPQRTVIQRFFDWVRNWFVRKGWMRHFPDDTKHGFWTDERVQSLIARSQDFVRSGDGWSFKYFDDRQVKMMRDADIFQLGVVSAINNATKTLTRNERRQMESKYPAGQAVPKEVPMFPEIGSPNIFKTAVQAASKQKLMTAKELELTNMSEKGEFNFFSDSTYEDIEELSNTIAGATSENLVTDWYKEVMPVGLASEMDTLLEVIKNPENFVSYRETDTPARLNTRAQLVQDAETRYAEIMNSKIDQKKTQLTKEHVLAYLNTDKIVTVTITPSTGYPGITYEEAATVILGPGYDVDAITDEEQQMIRDEIALTRDRGYNIGFSPEQQLWHDRREYADYADSTPEGANFGDDYRVAFIRQKGGGIRVGQTGHFGGTDQAGVLVHVRTGVAEVFDIEGQDFPITWREGMEGKLLSLVEQQSDWLQSLRKQYKSGDERTAGENRHRQLSKAIRATNKEMGVAISDVVSKHIEQTLLPAANVPTGSLKEEFDSYLTETFGTSEPSGMSESEYERSYKDFRNQRVAPLLETLQQAKEFAENAAQDAEGLMGPVTGSLDARAFERLDNYVVRQVAQQLVYGVDDLMNKVRRLQDLNTQKVFVDQLKSSVLSNVMRHLNRSLASGWDENSDTRLPMAKAELSKMMTGFFESMGIESAAEDAGRIVDNMKSRVNQTYKVPMEVMQDYGSAVRDNVDPYLIENMVGEWFENTRLLAHGVNTNKFSIDVKQSPSGETIDINVIGSESGLQELNDKITEIVEGWVDEKGQETLDRNLGNARRTPQPSPTANRTDPEWIDVVDQLDLDEIEVDDRSTELDDEGVFSYEEYEDDHFSDELDEVVASRMRDMDWDGITNEDGESLDRDGADYRGRLEIDEDGDVDNSDAERWLRNGRDQYEGEIRQEDDIQDEARNNVRIRFDADPTMLWTGDLPTEWDEDGDVINDVPLALKQTEVGGNAELMIDGDLIDYWYSHDDAKKATGRAIRSWYDNHVDTVPTDNILSPSFVDPNQQALPLPEPEPEPEKPARPNWGIIKSSITDGISRSESSSGEDTQRMFEEMVRLSKKSGTGVDTPLLKDEYWRNMVLKFLISDAVRRGFPGIVWNPGLATSARGGASFDGVATDRIAWSLEKIDIRGEEQEVWVVSSLDMDKPIVVSKQHAVPILGADVAGYINQQIAGKLELKPPFKDASGAPLPDPSADDYMISEVEGTDRVIVHRRINGAQIGFFDNRQEAETEIDAIAERDRLARISTAPTEPGETITNALGEVIMQGEVNKDVIGSKIRIIKGHRPRYYTHTFGVPTLAGARQSYEEISPRIWGKTLAKYGVKISEIYIKARNLSRAESRQGARIVKTDNRAEAIRQRHGTLSVREVTGSTHGWVVVSENEGVIGTDIWTDRQYAEDRLKEYTDNEFGNPDGGIKAFYIPINDKLREEFSGPVPPFHYDPTQDPALKDAAEKIGYEKTTLRERVNKWSEAWKDTFNQGVFDRFHGIKRAVSRAGVSLSASADPYVQTRLTTSLDSVMKSVLEYGAPTWKEGIMQNEGTGLLEILQPVMNDIDLWGMYMAGVRAKRLLAEGRERLFEPEQIDAMVALGDKYPAFKRVAADYAAFNKKVLDFAQESGVINPDTRSLWENADYVPFYRVEDERLVGPFSGSAGIANQNSPVKRLKGGDANIGNVTHNIMVNLTKLMDTSMKNHAALLAVDALRGSGIVSKKPMTHSQEMIPLQQVKKLLIDRGMNPNTIPQSALDGFQKMFAIQPPSGPGVISVLRDGKKEFYFTDDELLYRAMTNINKKAWGPWMNLFRAPKRLLTTMVTLDPGFMTANFVRDTLSAFVLSRDKYIPIAAGIKGFGQALVKDDAMRTMLSAGAAFESGYINQYDPQATAKLIKKKMKKKSFARTVLNSPAKLFEAWKAIGSASENANRLAVYNAAIRAGKGKARAAFEAKDLMDFSMSGDWPAVQFLVQTVPFLGARMQGLHRLGRGFAEHPVAFTMKGIMVGMAGLALWFAFRDDERYKELEEWDKDTYFHWWIGDNHYRLPKPFEVGAIFNTIPERIMEYMYSNENDAGKLLMRRFGFMITETFNANPMPQTFRPMVESYFNYNFFTGRAIVSPYEQDRMAPEEYRNSTSPTFIEMARAMPGGLDTASGKVRSPLHLENLYRGYTGTLGRYFLMAADELVRQQMDYPNPPEFRTGDYPVTGRFVRGSEPRRTKYEEEVYRLIRKTAEVQGSLRFLEKTEQLGRFENIQTEWEPYIRVADSLESIRESVSDINKAIMQTHLDENMDPADKRTVIDDLQQEKNILFEMGYDLRPGGAENPEVPVTQEQIINLIENFGVDEVQARQLEDTNPETFDLVGSINTLGMRELERLSEIRNK